MLELSYPYRSAKLWLKVRFSLQKQRKQRKTDPELAGRFFFVLSKNARAISGATGTVLTKKRQRRGLARRSAKQGYRDRVRRNFDQSIGGLGVRGVVPNKAIGIGYGAKFQARAEREIWQTRRTFENALAAMIKKRCSRDLLHLFFNYLDSSVAAPSVTTTGVSFTIAVSAPSPRRAPSLNIWV